MKRVSGLGLWVVLIVVSTLFVEAQTASTGALAGTVTDPTGSTVPNVKVVVISAGTGQERSVTTGSDGGYRFALLPPGNYRIRFNVAGFKTSEVSDVAINVTETPNRTRLRLKPTWRRFRPRRRRWEPLSPRKQ